MKIRLATHTDLETILKLCDSNTSVAFIKKQINNKDVYVGELDSTLVATIIINYIWTESVPLIAWVGVDKAQRNQGLAQKLLSHVFDVLKNKGHKQLLRSAATDKIDSIAYLSSLQLSPAGALTFPDGIVELFYWQTL